MGRGAALGWEKGNLSLAGRSMLKGVVTLALDSEALNRIGSDPRRSPTNVRTSGFGVPRTLVLLANTVKGAARVEAWKMVFRKVFALLVVSTEGLAAPCSRNSWWIWASLAARFLSLASAFSCVFRALRSCCLTSLSTRSSSLISASSSFAFALISFLVKNLEVEVGVTGGEERLVVLPKMLREGGALTDPP